MKNNGGWSFSLFTAFKTFCKVESESDLVMYLISKYLISEHLDVAVSDSNIASFTTIIKSLSDKFLQSRTLSTS